MSIGSKVCVWQSVSRPKGMSQFGMSQSRPDGQPGFAIPHPANGTVNQLADHAGVSSELSSYICMKGIA